MAGIKQKISFTTVNELLGVPVLKDEIVQVKIEDLVSFENHPFKVVDNDDMGDLINSIKENGLINPIIIRNKDSKKYEIIAGHRRVYACKKLGITEVSAYIKDLDDDSASIMMVDSNIQRTNLLPSELAKSLLIKVNAIKRKGKRNDLLTSDHNGRRLNEETSDHNERRLESTGIVGKDIGMSQTTVKRYIRLTFLINDLLNLVDANKLNFGLAIDISFFKDNIQHWIYDYIQKHGTINKASIEQIKKIISEKKTITKEQFLEIMLENKKEESKKVSFSEKKLNKYFPESMSSKEREEVIISLLKKWKSEQN